MERGEEEDSRSGFGSNAEAGPSRPRSRRAPRGRPRSNNPAPVQRPSDASPDALSLSGSRVGSPSGSEYDDERQADGLRWYVSDLGWHMKTSLAGLEGKERVKVDDAHDNYTYTDQTASRVPPSNTLWSGSEKSRFFAALSHHSRLRPDLIAAEMGSKTEAQVGEYLSALRWEAKRSIARKGEGNESKTWRNHLLWTGAYEVPESFVGMEASLAEEVERRTIAHANGPHERQPRRTQMSNKEKLDEWGREIGPDKLYALSSLMRISEQTDMNDLEGITAEQDSESEDDTEDPIAKDDAEIDAIQAIPKPERTPSQRARLRTLLNRKASRERSRTKALVKLGFTAEQIAEGGADTLYAAMVNKPKKKKGARRKLHDEVRAPDADVQELVDMDANGFFVERGWEVFNYRRVAQLLSASGEMYDDLPSGKLEYLKNSLKPEPSPEPTPEPTTDTAASATTTSLTAIDDLYAELLAYIKPLVYSSIIVAEQQHPQLQRLFPNRTPSVGVEHVFAALGLRGELNDLRQFSVEHKVERRRSMSREGTGTPVPELGSPRPSMVSSPATSRASSPASSTPVPVNHKRKRAPSEPLSPDPVSWTAASAAPLLNCDHAPEDSDTDMDDDLDDDLLINGKQADMEDEELDAALHQADLRLDAVMGAQLEDALQDDDDEMRVDDFAWARPGRRSTRDLRPVDDALVAQLNAAQDEYCAKVQEVHVARRSRAVHLGRAELFPRTRQVRRAQGRMDPYPWKDSRRARAEAARRGKREPSERSADERGSEIGSEDDDENGHENDENDESDAMDDEEPEGSPSEPNSPARFWKAAKSRTESASRDASSRRSSSGTARQPSFPPDIPAPSLNPKQELKSDPLSPSESPTPDSRDSREEIEEIEEIEDSDEADTKPSLPSQVVATQHSVPRVEAVESEGSEYDWDD